MKNIYIASDHAGVDLKSFLTSKISDLGAFNLSNLGTDSKNSVDYPDFGKKLSQKVSSEPDSIGIAICGSGIGISIAVNRNSKIRAALCCNTEQAKLSRQHNDANVLCLGARFLANEEALDIVKSFLNTPFEGGRHSNRVLKLGDC